MLAYINLFHTYKVVLVSLKIKILPSGTLCQNPSFKISPSTVTVWPVLAAWLTSVLRSFRYDTSSFACAQIQTEASLMSRAADENTNENEQKKTKNSDWCARKKQCYSSVESVSKEYWIDCLDIQVFLNITACH